MNQAAWLSILIKVLTSKAAKRVIIALMAMLARRTDTTVDDEIVIATAGALEIRVPDHGIPDVPADKNIFLGNDQLDAIKRDRPKLNPSMHEDVG